MAELFGGAVLGAVVGEVLQLLIEEAKKVFAFKTLSKDLASAIEKLIQSTEKIASLLNELDLGVEDLKELKETIERARVLIGQSVKSYNARKIEQINKDILKFCQTDLQLLQQKTLLQSQEANKKDFQILNEKVDRLSVPAQPVFRNLCPVPKLKMVSIGLEGPSKELQKKLLDNSVDSLVVSGPPGCGKTTLFSLVGEFKNIFFSVVSSTPNFRVIVQNLLQHNGYHAFAFDDDSHAETGLSDLLEELTKSGPTLLVLDDVWHGAEFLLQNFQIDLPGYKILVTSRSDFPSLPYTYQLKPLKDKDARSLLIQWASPPHHTSHEYEELLQKILKRCDGFPLVIEVVGVSLKGKALNLWKGQVESWSEGETILGNPHPTVLERLQPSFNALKPQLKERFLDMGSFLEDQKIRASLIIDIWVELYGKGSSSSSSYMYLNHLASQNLLKLVPLGEMSTKTDSTMSC